MIERFKDIGFELYNSNTGWSYYRYYATHLDNIEYYYSLAISSYSTEFRVFLDKGSISSYIFSDDDGDLVDEIFNETFKIEIRENTINQILNDV
jgi:hypothetical protein